MKSERIMNSILKNKKPQFWGFLFIQAGQGLLQLDSLLLFFL